MLICMDIAHRIFELYASENMVKKSIGVWLKFSYEFLTVAIILFILVHLFALFHPDLIVSYRIMANSSLVISTSLSLTVTGIMWCFTFSAIHPVEEDE